MGGQGETRGEVETEDDGEKIICKITPQIPHLQHKERTQTSEFAHKADNKPCPAPRRTHQYTRSFLFSSLLLSSLLSPPTAFSLSPPSTSLLLLTTGVCRSSPSSVCSVSMVMGGKQVPKKSIFTKDVAPAAQVCAARKSNAISLFSSVRCTRTRCKALDFA
eukprot:3420561-Rhodomonas_salina.2